MEWNGHHLVVLGYAILPRLFDHWPDGTVCSRFHGGGPKLPLHCPPGVLGRLAGVGADVDLRAVFDVHPVTAEEGFTLTFAPNG